MTGESSGATGSSLRDAVVRPLARASGRACARPGCPAPARATLSFSYQDRQAHLGPLSDQPQPATYDLCGTHADRTSPPSGWVLRDDRPDRPHPGEAGRLGDERTVAVLAEALRRSGRPVEEPAPLLDEDPLREALEELQSVQDPDAATEARVLAIAVAEFEQAARHHGTDEEPTEAGDSDRSTGTVPARTEHATLW